MQLMLAGERFKMPGPNERQPPTEDCGSDEESTTPQLAGAESCWVKDIATDHSCTIDAECGVDVHCARRTCSKYGFCG